MAFCGPPAPRPVSAGSLGAPLALGGKVRGQRPCGPSAAQAILPGTSLPVLPSAPSTLTPDPRSPPCPPRPRGWCQQPHLRVRSSKNERLVRPEAPSLPLPSSQQGWPGPVGARALHSGLLPGPQTGRQGRPVPSARPLTLPSAAPPSGTRPGSSLSLCVFSFSHSPLRLKRKKICFYFLDQLAIDKKYKINSAT